MISHPPLAALYRRVSTDRQDGSLEVQEAKAYEYARFKGLTIPDDLRFGDEATSGSIEFSKRAGGGALQRSIELWRNAGTPIEHVVITKLDRLGRDAWDLENTFRFFKAQNVTVHIVDFGGDSFTTAGFLGDLILRILSAVAEFERMMIRSRIQDRLDAKRAKRQLCGTIPYGWDCIYTFADAAAQVRRVELSAAEAEALGHGGIVDTLMVPNETEQTWIRRIHHWRTVQHWSFPAIARELNRLGVATKTPPGTLIKTRTGHLRPTLGRWQAGNVAKVLQSRSTKELLRHA
jgi:putative DNA-invertase from lambdoid prophage Rac